MTMKPRNVKKKMFVECELPCGSKIEALRDSGDTVWKLSIYDDELIEEVQIVGKAKNIRAIKKFLDAIAMNTPWQSKG